MHPIKWLNPETEKESIVLFLKAWPNSTGKRWYLPRKAETHYRDNGSKKQIKEGDIKGRKWGLLIYRNLEKEECKADARVVINAKEI